MANKILYANKEKLLDDITIPDKNKVTANDMNEIKEVVNAHADDIELLETNKADRTEIPTDLSELSNETTKFVNETQLANAVLNEKTERQNADNNLQTQIDGIVAQSDVVDIVGTYQELLSYDTSKLTENDIIKVLSDSTHNNATSYYRWENNSWAYVGSEGPYYTKGETDERLNQKANQSSLNETNQNVSALSGRVGTNESDIRDIKAEQITQNTQIATLIADSGNKIELSVNSANYVMTATLKNKAGEILNTSSIDLPIEAMIINARYDSATKELVLTLQNGNTIRVSIEDIIDGLVSQTDFDDLVVRVEDIEDEQETQNASIEELQEQVEILENTVESELEDATATGESITVNDSANAPAKLLPSGNTEQNQYTGKNLVPTQSENWEQGSINNATGELTESTTRIRTKNYYPISAGEHYISIQNNLYCWLNIIYYNSNKQYITSQFKISSIDTYQNKQITIPENTAFYKAVIRKTTSTQSPIDISDIFQAKPQIETGTSATSYEPYTGGKEFPNPEQESVIHNLSGHNEFLVQNAINIFNMEEYANQNSYYFDYSNEGLTIKHKDNRAIANVLPAINVEGNTSYYIKSDIDITVSVAQYTNTGTWITTASVQNNQEFTTDINAKTIKLKIGINISSFPTLIGKVYFSTSKEYKKQTAEFTLVEGQKMFLGDYLADDEIHHVDGESVFDGSDDENWSIQNIASGYNFYIKINQAEGSNLNQIYSNRGKYKVFTTSEQNVPDGSCFISATKNLNYKVSNISTLADFRTFLSTNNLKVQYKLATETIEPYTELQQAQYNRLKKMLSYYQQTNVKTITAGDLEAILNLDYKKSNRLRIDALEQAIISLGGNV